MHRHPPRSTLTYTLFPSTTLFRARSEHLQGVVPQQNCSVLINTYTNHPGILRHGAQKSADASAFGEMLINDGIANEAQSGCHMEIAYAVRFPARSLYQHCFAHHRCTGGGAGDQAAASVNVPKHSFDRRISDLA